MLLSDLELDEEKQQQISHIKEAGEHLLDLINDIIDLSTLETGKIKFISESFILEKLISDCLVLTKLSAEKRGIKISDQVSNRNYGKVYADYTRLKQVILNLLSNAVKYNIENGQVIISCLNQDGYLKIEISDTGPGLSQEQIERLFVEFERAGAEHSNIQGTGIGLTISRRLIESMNEKIGVTSSPGKGAVFWITVPVARS